MIDITNDSKYLNKHREYTEHYNDECPIAELDVNCVENGIILPRSELYIARGGVLDADGSYLPISSIENNGSFICIEDGYDVSEYDRNDNSVIYLGYFFEHWGHFLMDCTTRMWILLDERYKDHKVVFPSPSTGSCRGNYKRFLELLGITDDRIIDITVPTQFKSVIIPTEARLQPENTHRAEWYAVFDRVVENACVSKESVPHKVYFSRAKMNKKEFGADEIEHNYRINGFTIVYPEKLSLDEQIGIFQYADEVVSENSSICMNVVFARKGLKWTVINKYSAIHDNFTELRYTKGLDITYVDAYSDRFDYFGSRIGSLPYLVSFNENMKKLFSDNGMTYKCYGAFYHLSNTIKYVVCSLLHKPKKKMRVFLEKTVRWMKRHTPGFYALLKKVIG